jgi:hypothetical protein
MKMVNQNKIAMQRARDLVKHAKKTAKSCATFERAVTTIICSFILDEQNNNDQQ